MIRMERSFAGWVAKATFHSFQAIFHRHMGTITSLKRFSVPRWRSVSGPLGTTIFDIDAGDGRGFAIGVDRKPDLLGDLVAPPNCVVPASQDRTSFSPVSAALQEIRGSHIAFRGFLPTKTENPTGDGITP
jgi:hypothetical protein